MLHAKVGHVARRKKTPAEPFDTLGYFHSLFSKSFALAVVCDNPPTPHKPSARLERIDDSTAIDRGKGCSKWMRDAANQVPIKLKLSRFRALQNDAIVVALAQWFYSFWQATFERANLAIISFALFVAVISLTKAAPEPFPTWLWSKQDL